MNPDLAMGGDLLKKTGAGNLFMVFGEPDVDIRRVGDELEIEVRGVDVYDPTTGEVRSGSTGDNVINHYGDEVLEVYEVGTG